MRLKAIATLGKRLPLLAIFSIAALLTGCGGGPVEGDPDFVPPSASPSQTFKPAQRSTQYGDFNPGIWNQHKWYECDCSRDPSQPVPG